MLLNLLNNGLDKVFENNVVRIAATTKLSQEAQQRRALKEAERLEVDPVTVSRVLSYAKAEEIDRLMPFYSATRQEKGTFDQGVKLALQAVLVSPNRTPEEVAEHGELTEILGEVLKDRGDTVMVTSKARMRSIIVRSALPRSAS